jgi:hypothetical protein
MMTIFLIQLQDKWFVNVLQPLKGRSTQPLSPWKYGRAAPFHQHGRSHNRDVCTCQR